MKVGKEELMGCLAAVERYLALDHAARGRRFEQIVSGWIDRLAGIPGVTAVRDFPNEANQPVPWIRVGFATAEIRKRIVASLRAGEPSVAVAEGPENSIRLNPMTLQDGEEQIVMRRLLEEIGTAVSP
jgi:L-seryl-tRNA(Ser) seleniumtransferase